MHFLNLWIVANGDDDYHNDDDDDNDDDGDGLWNGWRAKVLKLYFQSRLLSGIPTMENFQNTMSRIRTCAEYEF